MSLITQCPACTTLFKVVPDQLRVSDGWVRCGQCDEVFDANAHLQTTQQEARQSTFGESQFPTEPVRSRFAPQTPPPVFKRPAVAHSELEPEVDPNTIESSSVLSLQDDAVLVPFNAPIRSIADAADAVVDSYDESESETEAAVRAEYEALLKTVAEEPDPVISADQEQEWAPNEELETYGKPTPRDEWADAIGEPVLSFMQSTPASEVVVRPWVRSAMFAFSVVLLLALVFQVAVRERDWLAAKAPAVTPLLIGMCDVVGCQVSALREIESVVIDSSSFVKVRTNVYRVHLTLKNTAIHEVAMPALELTLTNVHDQPIARRIIPPREYGVTQVAMPPGAELLATVAISAKLSPDTEQISGYRLLVFYP